MSEGEALYKRIQESISDIAPQLVYSDWLEENGRENEAESWRGKQFFSFSVYDFYGSGLGFFYYVSRNYINSGYGNGIGGGFSLGEEAGYGYGFGFGDGYGGGYGDGSREGFSSESGEGTGDGSGYARRYGSAHVDPEETEQWESSNRKIIEGRPVIGKQMLIWCGHGFALIGLVEEMYAPGCYKLSNGGMLCRTGESSWMDVAADKNRSTYVYRHAPDGIIYTGPIIHGAIEWKGELPGKDVG